MMGRMVRDPEVKVTPSNLSVSSFTIAVDRKFKNASGERQADFINCVAWRQQSDFISKYFHKGSKIAIVGSLQSRSWEDKEGKRHSTMEVIVDEVFFAGDKGSAQATTNAPYDPASAPAAIPAGDELAPAIGDEPYSLPFDV